MWFRGGFGQDAARPSCVVHQKTAHYRSRFGLAQVGSAASWLCFSRWSRSLLSARRKPGACRQRCYGQCAGGAFTKWVGWDAVQRPGIAPRRDSLGSGDPCGSPPLLRLSAHSSSVGSALVQQAAPRSHGSGAALSTRQCFFSVSAPGCPGWSRYRARHRWDSAKFQGGSASMSTFA
jgi:hypothetical protein